jgi:hypothetical protein
MRKAFYVSILLVAFSVPVYASSFGDNLPGSGNWGLKVTNSLKGAKGLYGQATNRSGGGSGVYGVSTGQSGRGVYGLANRGGGKNIGVFGESKSNQGKGVMGFASKASGTTYGVFGRANSPDGWGLYTPNSAHVGDKLGIGTTSPTETLDISGNISVSGTVDGVDLAALSAADGEDYDSLADLQAAVSDDFHNLGGVDETDDSVSWAEIAGIVGTSVSTVAAGDDSRLHVKNLDNSLAAADGTPTNAVYVDNAGNVGIGTTGPNAAKLVVDNGFSGNLVSRFTTGTGASSAIEIESTSGGTKRWSLRTNGPGASGPGGPSSFNIIEDGYAGTIRMIVKPGGNVGIGTTTPSAKLDVVGNTELNGDVDINSDLDVDEGTLHVNGTNNRVGIGTTSPGAKLDVEVSSGGAATIGSSTCTATGNYAVAMGVNTNASGSGSTAMGQNTIASGSGSTAMGRGSLASHTGSTAMGEDTTASGIASTAMGKNTIASGYASTAMGQNTIG